MENINPNLSLDDQAELLPYDKKWEFPIEQLKLGKFKNHITGYASTYTYSKSAHIVFEK